MLGAAFGRCFRTPLRTLLGRLLPGLLFCKYCMYCNKVKPPTCLVSLQQTQRGGITTFLVDDDQPPPSMPVAAALRNVGSEVHRHIRNLTVVSKANAG